MYERLTETGNQEWCSEATVNRDTRLIENVVLCGPVSQNGYSYPAETLSRSRALYENVPVFLDHGSDLKDPHNRSTRDLAGTVRNPRMDGPKLRGDVQALDTDAGRAFLGIAEGRVPRIGMSQVVLAKRNEDNTSVEDIKQVISVDCVAYPATTNSLSEQTRSEDDMSDVTPYKEQIDSLKKDSDTLRSERDSSRQELKDLREQHDKLTKERESLDAEIKQLTEECGELKLKVDGFETQQKLAERRKKVLDEIRAQKLDPDSKDQVSDVFLEAVLATEDDDRRKALIKERAELVKNVPTSTYNHERKQGGSSDFDPSKMKPVFT